MSNWWYRQDANGITGPYSLEELKFLGGRGQLLRTDMLRAGDDGLWKAAGNVEAVFSSNSSIAMAAKKQPIRPPRTPRPTVTRSVNLKVSPTPVTNSDLESASIPRSSSPPLPPVNRSSPDRQRKKRQRWATAGGVVLALLLVVVALWLLK